MEYCTQMSTCTQLEADGSLTTVERPCRNPADGPLTPFASGSQVICRFHRAAIIAGLRNMTYGHIESHGWTFPEDIIEEWDERDLLAAAGITSLRRVWQPRA